MMKYNKHKEIICFSHYIYISFISASPCGRKLKALINFKIIIYFYIYLNIDNLLYINYFLKIKNFFYYKFLLN